MSEESTLKKVEVNTSDLEFLIRAINDDLVFLRKVKLDMKSARRILTAHYDLLTMVFHAMGLKHNYMIYSHGDFLVFLLEIKENEISRRFNKFKRLRDRLIFRGETITPVEARIIISDIRTLTVSLVKKYLQ